MIPIFAMLLSSLMFSLGFQGLIRVSKPVRFNVLFEMTVEGPESLTKLTNKFVSTNFGISDSSILAPDLIVVDKLKVQSKEKYMSEFSKSYSAISRCLPDLDFRPSAFLYDESESDVMRCVIRPVGTISGPYAIDGEVYIPPSNVEKKKIEFAPQVITLKFQNEQVKYF